MRVPGARVARRRVRRRVARVRGTLPRARGGGVGGCGFQSVSGKAPRADVAGDRARRGRREVRGARARETTVERDTAGRKDFRFAGGTIQRPARRALGQDRGEAPSQARAHRRRRTPRRGQLRLHRVDDDDAHHRRRRALLRCSVRGKGGVAQGAEGRRGGRRGRAAGPARAARARLEVRAPGGEEARLRAKGAATRRRLDRARRTRRGRIRR